MHEAPSMTLARGSHNILAVELFWLASYSDKLNQDFAEFKTDIWGSNSRYSVSLMCF